MWRWIGDGFYSYGEQHYAIPKGRHDSIETYLEIAAMREVYAAVVKTTEERLRFNMNDYVGLGAAVLGESLPTAIFI